MWTAVVQLCVVIAWCAGAYVRLPPPCAPEYHFGGRAYHCEAGHGACPTIYVRHRFIYNADTKTKWDVQKDETCSLCLPSYCCPQSASPGVYSAVQLNGSLEFFGFQKTGQTWERWTSSEWTIVLPASPKYYLYYPISECHVLYENYEPTDDIFCPTDLIYVSTCPNETLNVNGTCVKTYNIGVLRDKKEFVELGDKKSLENTEKV
ncbi:hypothetical protein EVAR_81888_1 [Eumeta japonica]|uniref:Uncharacterized protein n=1 Tax=Eumeta variegata TaxID=151549 RepID=A0A4C1UXM0_EUMVA|nr:hypothetical protein EVAR_81888_1 [Eumeta japonica]